MAKLPVNLLLSTLYLGSAALIGGIGWTFYETWKLKEKANTPPFHKAIADKVDTHLEDGRKAQPERKNWRYDPEMLSWWTQFHNVNITGKLPPEPEEKEPEKVEEAPKDAGIPIDQLVVLESLLLDVTGATDAELRTHVVVRYKQGVTVNPPAEPSGAPAGTGAAAWGPGDSVPRPTGGPSAPIPMAGAQTEVRQFVHLGETLWPPHNTLRLVRISDDGQTAYFLREDRTKEQGEWKEERLDKNSLDLPPDVARVLTEGRRQAAGGANGAANGEPTPPVEPEVSVWRDPPQTGEVTPGNVHISRNDYDYISENSDRVFNEEIAVSTYKSTVGNYEGLRIDRISPRLQAFGLQPGDIILSVNGEKVKNKTNAYAVGRRQYDAGTRRFVVEVLDGRGRGVQTRTLTVPDKR